jgi:uncharacterized protein (TIGR02653 family)
VGRGGQLRERYLHIPPEYPRDYERLLTGGVWAQIDVRYIYDDESKGKHSFWISQLDPIQIATFNLDEYRAKRTEFTTDEWTDFMIRSMGYEPAEMDRRLKLLFLTRLIPLAERNYNLVELGPRGTGKSYVIQEISPYASLLTGPTTVANLFGHMTGKQKGMVQIWDVVGFDEVADLQKMPKEVITTMKTYCESGSYQRGTESASGDASIAMFGNTNQPVEVMVQSGHLFEPMPDIIRNDMAFIDRLHYYLPGWEVPKMRTEHFTDHYGFVVDYLAEALRELRKQNYTEVLDRTSRSGRTSTPRPQGRAQDGVGADEDPPPARHRQPGRPRRDRRVRDRGPAPGEGAAQEDGLVRVLPDLVQLHHRGDRRGALRRRARAGRARPDRLDPLAPGSAYAAGSRRTARSGCSGSRCRCRPAPASSRWPAA